MSDLYELITKRQDELRGRPRNWRDDLKDWAIGVDWSFVGFVTCLLIWGACHVFIEVAGMIYGI